MTGSFLAIALLTAVLLVNWRVVLLALAAGLIALIAIGLGVVNTADSHAVGQPAAPAAVSPADISPPQPR